MRNNGIHIRIADIIYGIIKRRLLIIGMTVAGLLVGVVLSGFPICRRNEQRVYHYQFIFRKYADRQWTVYFGL